MISDICQHDYSLRDYQQDAKEKIFGQWEHADNIMYQMPTGTGKTRLFTSIIRDISVAGLRGADNCHILIIAHRTELIEQISESLDKYRIHHGIIAGTLKHKRNLRLAVQVASIQTITHPSNVEVAIRFNPNFIIIDEAHHALAKSYVKLWDLFPASKKLGVTATPWRMNGCGFRELFDSFIPSMSIKEFIDKGWLAKYDYYSVATNSSISNMISAIDEFGIDGDYRQEAMERAMDNNRIRAQLIDSYLSFAQGKKGIIYSISQLHSKHICENYREVGVRIAEINGTTPTSLRRRLVNDFKTNKLDILVNVDIFSEGFDCPNIEFIQLSRPTKSLVKYIQQIGRGLRRNGGKRCIILDNVGLYNNFGLPDDDRDWNKYFEGQGNDVQNEELPKSLGKCVKLLRRRKDLSEGSDEMILIQSGKGDCCESDSDTSQIRQSETRSIKIFAKYCVVKKGSSIFVENVRTLEQQQLLDYDSADNCRYLKVVKAIGLEKSFNVYSSLNNRNSPDSYDKFIGMFYREGRLIKFKMASDGRVIKLTI